MGGRGLVLSFRDSDTPSQDFFSGFNKKVDTPSITPSIKSYTKSVTKKGGVTQKNTLPVRGFARGIHKRVANPKTTTLNNNSKVFPQKEIKNQNGSSPKPPVKGFSSPNLPVKSFSSPKQGPVKGFSSPRLGPAKSFQKSGGNPNLIPVNTAFVKGFPQKDADTSTKNEPSNTDHNKGFHAREGNSNSIPISKNFSKSFPQRGGKFQKNTSSGNSNYIPVNKNFSKGFPQKTQSETKEESQKDTSADGGQTKGPQKREREDPKETPPSKRRKNEDHATMTQTLALSVESTDTQDNEVDDRKTRTTSLFKGNPDIPSIPASTITRVSEKVFSESAFSTLDIAPQIISNVEKLGFTSMTQVQAKSIPPILAGQDTLVKSQTGSGKTLTYALPVIHKLMTRSTRVQRSDGVLALVVVPTRELALQSYQWFEKLCKSCVWVVPGYLIGGEKKKSEKARLRKGINILVGTPGRLIDHLFHTKSLSVANVQFLIIDEADRLLDMGYEKNLTCIMETLNEQQPGLGKSRQTIMLSATLSSGVEKLAGVSLMSPEIVDITYNESKTGELGQLTSETMATPANLTHHYILVPAKLRLVTLAAFILSKCKFGSEKKMIVFFATQDMVDYHTALFTEVITNYGKPPKQEKKSSLMRRAEKVLAGGADDGEGSEDEEDIEEDDYNHKQPQPAQEDKDTILFQKLHGSMTQKDRCAVFKSFRAATSGVLMCTDVAARGLDLPKVRWIVQFSAASSVSDYVHRVGRTARVNAAGAAIIFLTPAEAPYIDMLQQHKIRLQEVTMQTILKNLMIPVDFATQKNVAGSVEAAATRFQVKIEKMLISNPTLNNMAKKAYVSFVRSYASYPRDVREMFNFKTLHLGHYAKSMGLRDNPSALGAGVAFRAKQEMKERRERKEKRRKVQVMNQRCGKLPRTAGMSEFDSGMDSMPKIPKKKGVKKSLPKKKT